jgi:transcriptional regulator with XRE-family HTH domain
MQGGHIVREARRRAGLSQRELAGRVGTTQPAIARVESGDSAPSFDRILRLVRACGFDLDIRVVPLDEDAWSIAEQGRSLSPDERLDRLLVGIELLEDGRRARTEER